MLKVDLQEALRDWARRTCISESYTCRRGQMQHTVNADVGPLTEPSPFPRRTILSVRDLQRCEYCDLPSLH